MRTSSIRSNMPISFSGVKKPYQLKNGTMVIPIAKNPSIFDIRRSIKATESKKGHPLEGLNGSVFCLGQDLVVKKYKGEQAINDDPYREINLLDSMFDTNLKFNNSQVGCYAFETPDGQAYLVSTRVKGENPNVYGNNLFTKQNLQSLTDIILQMDKGRIVPGSSPHGFNERCRFMNYDFNGKNINITPSEAGLFDFEYDKFENIDEQIFDNIIIQNYGYNCNQSDTSGLPSSMRSFEYWTLCDYLKCLDSPKEIFNDYLEIKSNYHRKMAEFFFDFAQQSSFPVVAMDIARKEAVHSRLLKKNSTGKIPADIERAEARKIQMANFLHEQSIYNSTGIVNPKQLAAYTEETLSLFKESLVEAQKNGDLDRTIYYQNGVELISQWSNVNGGLRYNIETKNPAVLKKITDKHITTLDEVLNK